MEDDSEPQSWEHAYCKLLSPAWAALANLELVITQTCVAGFETTLPLNPVRILEIQSESSGSSWLDHLGKIDFVQQLGHAPNNKPIPRSDLAADVVASYSIGMK